MNKLSKAAFITSLLLFWGQAPSAEAQQSQRCLSTHLHEALAINTHRRQIYGAWSGGRSQNISELLIRSEQIALLSAQILEHWEANLQKAGVLVFCEDLVPMANTPEIERNLEPQELSLFQPDRVISYRRELRKAWKKDSYSGLLQRSQELLASIEPAHDYHCMLRHLLESIARGAAQAPQQIAKSEAVGEGWRARKLINTYLALQIELITTGRMLDQQAAPLQAEGINIICNDVPKIEIPSLDN